MVHINDLWLADYGIFHSITCVCVRVRARFFYAAEALRGPGGAAISLCNLQTINSLICTPSLCTRLTLTCRLMVTNPSEPMKSEILDAE